MALMAIASGLGAARYAGLDQLERVHTGASHLAGAIAPATFGLVAILVVRDGRRWILDVGLASLFVGWALFDVLLKISGYRTVVAALGLVLLAGAGASQLRKKPDAGAAVIVGGIGIALAGLVIGTDGDFGPMKAIDLFHLVLVLSHALVAYGLMGLPTAD